MTRHEVARTLDRLAGFLVDLAPLADDGHHALHLLDVLLGTVLLLERLPDLQEGDALPWS